MGRTVLAGAAAGLVIVGVLIGIDVTAPIKKTSDHAWSLTGSALGAALAVIGSLLAFQYQQRVAELTERRRIQRQLDAILALIAPFEAEAKNAAPDRQTMYAQMQQMIKEYQIASAAAVGFANTSAEIARCSQELSGHYSQMVANVAEQHHQEEWVVGARANVDELMKAVRRARAQLQV